MAVGHGLESFLDAPGKGLGGGPLLVPSHFVHWEMKGGAAEEAREIGGLFIVFLGSALVVAGARGLTPGGRAPGSR